MNRKIQNNSQRYSILFYSLFVSGFCKIRTISHPFCGCSTNCVDWRLTLWFRREVKKTRKGGKEQEREQSKAMEPKKKKFCVLVKDVILLFARDAWSKSYVVVAGPSQLFCRHHIESAMLKKMYATENFAKQVLLLRF